MLWSDVTGYGTTFSSTIPPLPVQSIQATHSNAPVLIDVVATGPVLIPSAHYVLLSAVFSSRPVQTRSSGGVLRPLHTSDDPGFVGLIPQSHTLVPRPLNSGPFFETGSNNCVDFHPGSSTDHDYSSIQSLGLPALVSIHPSIHPSHTQVSTSV